MRKALLLFLTLGFHGICNDIPFGMPGGPSVRSLGLVFDKLQEDNYQAELLISFGTSSKGSAGHLALSIREGQRETVYSANFYADRAPEHENSYNEELMVAIPKKEYIYGVNSTLSEKAVFGLDFGEIFQRSLIGVRIYGLTPQHLNGMKAFFNQMNKDYQNRTKNTDYQFGEVVYDYMKLNCAKTIAAGFRFGAGFDDVKVTSRSFWSGFPGSKYLLAHVPTATTMDILEVLSKQGMDFDVILYKKYAHSQAIHSDFDMEFKDLPNRFPSVKSLDYFNGQTNYEDYDNLETMNLFYLMGTYALSINERTKELQFESRKEPVAYKEAIREARSKARKKSKNLVRRLVRSLGVKISDENDNSDLYPDGPIEDEDKADHEPLDVIAP